MVRTSVYNRREKRQGRVRRTLLSGSPWAISKACCVGTVLAAATLHSIAAKAADREISDDLTDPVRTSDGDGTGPGDITITDAGSVSVGSGAAVIIDSDNTVTSSGLISSDALVDAIGIFALTGTGVTSGIENQGTITIVPDAQDDDATGPNFGIRLEGTGLFTGTIVNGEDGVITVGGDGSVGIDAQAGVAGSITNDGEITVTGENAVGIRVTGGVTGNVESNGSISAAASGGTGVEVSGDVGGRVVNRGAITTGTASFRDEDDADIIRQDSGGPGILIGADVAGGILNEGDGEFPDEDGNTPDENDTADAVITARGSANAILVSSTAGSGAPRDLTVGALGTGEEAFAIVNRGQLASSAEIEGLDTVTVRIEGGTVGSDVFTATLDGGIHNAGGEITSASVDADATAISIGDHATVPEIRNSGLISAASRVTASDEDGDGENDTFGPGGDATGIVIDAQGQVDTITNAGRIVVTAAGQTASAGGIVDRGKRFTADLNLTKTIDNAEPAVDTDVTYTLTLGNAGPQSTAKVEVTDHLPDCLDYVSSTADRGSYDPDTWEWAVGKLKVGESVSLDIVATVTADCSGEVINTAEVTNSSLPDFASSATAGCHPTTVGWPTVKSGWRPNWEVTRVPSDSRPHHGHL